MRYACGMIFIICRENAIILHIILEEMCANQFFTDKKDTWWCPFCYFIRSMTSVRLSALA